ncbi:MAG: type II toxin-antitoxin system death-on-curing family toxin [Planctomycetes bacterium]|nr:type II toxin-antitoxin system death-on-curing family toxin [Planctomycetota bacterium]
MTTRHAFLTVEHVLSLHRRLIESFGGDPGLRDRGMLESAVSVPRATFDGRLLHRGVPAIAAAYHFHLCKNHPFVDGNKRIALAAAEVFLLLNGFELRAGDDAVEALTMGVASGAVSKDEVSAFFRRHAQRV